MNFWDIVVGLLMVCEVGGFVSDFDGKNKILESGDVVVGNEYVYKYFLCLLKKVEDGLV